MLFTRGRSPALGVFLGSIRARLLLLFGLVFVVVTITAMYRMYERRASDTGYFLDGLQAQAKFIAEQQSDAVRRTERFLAFMTSVLDVAELAKNPDCAAKLNTYTKNDDYLANVFITDRQGVVICSSRATLPPGSNVSDRAYFQQALQSQNPVAGDPLYGRFTNRWVLPFVQQYRDEKGQAQGVIVVALDLAWVNKAFNRIALNKGMRLGLVTSKGIVLARQPDQEAWIGKDISSFPAFRRLLDVNGDGTTEEISHDGQRRIYAFAPFPKTSQVGVYVWLTVPAEVATAKADQQFFTAMLLISCLVSATFSLAWFGGTRFLVRPIERLALAARQLAKGDFAARTGLAHSAGEIGQLATAFDEMANQLTRFDTLTGLLNLRSFEDLLAPRLAEAKINGEKMAVLRLKIKKFHDIENSYGVAIGHEVIKFVGQHLQRSLGNAVVARLGENNFAVAYPDVEDALQVTQFVEALQVGLEQSPLVFGNVTLNIECCFGVSLFPDDGASVHDLLQHSSVALGLALNDTTTHLRFYEQAMNDRLFKRARRLTELRKALQMQSFELHYQPQRNLNSGRLVGLEALVRWNHPEEGRIAPGEFIGLAEESGLIAPLGDWILRRAVTQLSEWRTAEPALASLVMAVNISAVQLAAGDFKEKLAQLLAEIGLPPGNLELEITESQLMSASSEPGDLIRKLKELGVQLSIDDFGTGYSSLSYLKHFDVDKLKIDKSFVDNVTTMADDAAIVNATIAMAHQLGLDVIAEGVEYAEQADYLRQLGCDQIQGYFLSRPLAAEQAFEFIRNHCAERSVSG